MKIMFTFLFIWDVLKKYEIISVKGQISSSDHLGRLVESVIGFANCMVQKYRQCKGVDCKGSDFVSLSICLLKFFIVLMISPKMFH